MTNLGTGSYNYIFTYEWTDNFGKICRSTTSEAVNITFGSGTENYNYIDIPTLRLTAKTGNRDEVRIGVYRTEANGSTYYRVNSIVNPTFNDTTVDRITFFDNLSDSELISRERLYTEGFVLDNAAPPSASLITTFANRIWLAGVGDPYTLWHSKSLLDGEVMEFAFELTVQCDPRGGAITALSSMDSALIVFKENAIFALNGDGPTNTGLGESYASPTLITTDVGCATPNSIAITSLGIIFQSQKGIVLLDRSFSIIDIGRDIAAYNHLTITATTVVADQNIVILTTNTDVALVYNYKYGQWSTFTGHASVDSIMWDNTFCFLNSNGLVSQQNKTKFTDGSKFYSLKLKTSWIQVAGLQGFQRIRGAAVLGEFISPHTLNIDISYDFNDSAFDRYSANATQLFTSNTWGSADTWGSAELWGGDYSPYHFVIPSIKRQTCQAVSFTLEDNQSSAYAEGYSITGLTLEIGTKRGLNKVKLANKTG